MLPPRTVVGVRGAAMRLHPMRRLAPYLACYIGYSSRGVGGLWLLGVSACGGRGHVCRVGVPTPGGEFQARFPGTWGPAWRMPPSPDAAAGVGAAAQQLHLQRDMWQRFREFRQRPLLASHLSGSWPGSAPTSANVAQRRHRNAHHHHVILSVISNRPSTAIRQVPSARRTAPSP
jgi:hypothetical protein